MKKLIECLKSKAMLRIAVFATLFVLMDTFIEMNKKTEEQVTYSITLEDLLHAQTETNGETGGTGGGGTDGETGGGTGGTGGGTGGGTTTGSGSPFAHQPGKETKNVLCIKEIGLTVLIKFGRRDKCRRTGSGCRPTRCL